LYYSRLGKNTVNAVRLAEVLQVFVRHGFADLLQRAGFHRSLPAKLLRSLNLMDAPTGPPHSFGQRLRAALVDLGPTFVKLGQILSTRPDLIRIETARELSNLQDRVDTLPFEKMEEVMREAFGAGAEELFATFETEPIASASLSQVYRATLQDGGDVAVKIQRPGVAKVIESDLSLMRQVAEWSADHLADIKWLDPPGIVESFARSIRRELDYTIEARVIEQFRANFDDDAMVDMPKVYPEFSSDTILTMDWIEGVRVDQVEEFAERNCEARQVAINGCDALCRMVFEHQLFHADPHPGNIFVTRDNHLAFLDLGMAGHLEQTDVAAIGDLFLALFDRDSRACVDAILVLTTGAEPADQEILERELTEFIAFEARAILGGGQVGRGLERTTQILQRANMELAPRFALLIKALATIEMVGRSLDPELDMVPIVQPYVERLIRRRYAPRQIFRDLQHNARVMLRLGQQMPRDLAHLMQQLRNGKLKFSIHHEHLDDLAATIDRASSRNTVGMIVAALIVGSSLLITTESTISRLGVGGFIFAGLLGSILVISILWTRKF
jgi:ubiquinone biosynthesis protein